MARVYQFLVTIVYKSRLFYCANERIIIISRVSVILVATLLRNFLFVVNNFSYFLLLVCK